MGTAIPLAATSGSSSSSTSLLLIVAVFVILMLFMFRSNRRRQQNAQNTQRQAVAGSRIRTVHGIYGTVTDSDDQNVMVEVAPGVHIKMLRQAIGTVLPDDAPDGLLHTMPSADDAEPEPDGDDPADRSDQRSDLSR